MSLNFRRLAPHHPLPPGDGFHVRRPRGSGDEIAARLLKGGGDAVAVVGPAGSGKSTELAQAALLLQDRFVVVQIPLERALDVHHATEDDVCLQVARRIHDIAAKNLGIRLPQDLIALLHTGPHPGAPAVPATELLLRTAREVQRVSSQGRIALLLDGLEKCPPEAALRAARAILAAKDKAALVLVAPYAITFDRGGQGSPFSGVHAHFVRAVPVRQDQGSEAASGRSFFREIVRSRLDVVSIPASLSAVLTRAAELSGGVLRVFLDLVRAAGAHANQGGRETSLLDDDLDAAARELREVIERSLKEGDRALLRAAAGTSGKDIPPDDRLRLLAQGLLLEEKGKQGTIVRPAPLLNDLLAMSETPVGPAPDAR